jgi:type VI secretion system secreted protein VgrG
VSDYEQHHASIQFANGETALFVVQFMVRERISRPFDIAVVVRGRKNNLDPETFVGRFAGFRAQTAAGEMVWTGTCESFEQSHAAMHNDVVSTYLVHIVPDFWLLTQRRGHRIFQHQTVKEIVGALLDEWGVDHQFATTQDYPKLEYRVQYGESDYAFVCRLLEEAGIAYTFRPDDAGGDTKSKIVFIDEVYDEAGSFTWVDNPSEAAQKPFLTNIHVGQSARPGAFAARDFDFRRPERKLLGEAPKAQGPEGTWEQYHYSPGGFLIDTGPGDGGLLSDGKSVARHRDDEGTKLATRRLEAARWMRRFVAYETNVLTLRPGFEFTIEGHPRSEDVAGKKVLVTESQTLGNASGEFRLLGTAVFSDGSFRIPLETPKPRIDGIQSATVVGPDKGSGKDLEIHVDEFGRVRVRFHWDREGKFDDNRTCWLRVSEGWAGAGYGAVTLPRVGDEVLVEFFDGDPDQPLVIGRLYKQPMTMPYLLPTNKTRSTWKTQTSPFADNSFNELMFEDTYTKELVFVQAQRNMMKLVKKDETRRVGEDRLDVIGAHRLAVVARIDAIHVGKQHLVQMVTSRSCRWSSRAPRPRPPSTRSSTRRYR